MNQPKADKALASLLLVLLLSACTQWRYELGTRLSPGLLPDNVQGSSLKEVLATLGPPLRVSEFGEGYILAWEFWKIREDTFGLSLGLLGIDLMSADWGNAHIHGEFLLVTFDRQHLATSSSFARWSNDAGGGKAIQPLLGLVSLADVEDMVDHLPHHQWGAALLRPPPESVNTQSRPDMGQSGIQRRGTPRGSGQQSLE